MCRWTPQRRADAGFGDFVVGALDWVPFVDESQVTVPWNQDSDTVEKNSALLTEYAQILADISTASTQCANDINRLVVNNSVAVIEAIPAQAFTNPEQPMPWGSPVDEDRNCPESVGHGAYTFGAETAQGAGMLLFGYNPESGDFFDGSAYGQAWGGLGNLVGSFALMSSPAGIIAAGMALTGNTSNEFFRHLSERSKVVGVADSPIGTRVARNAGTDLVVGGEWLVMGGLRVVTGLRDVLRFGDGVLPTAAGTRISPSAGPMFAAVSYDDPLGPDEDPVAPASGDDEDDRWYMGDNTLRHDAAAEAALEALQGQLAGPDGVLAGTLGLELPVPKGSKNNTGLPGRADIYYDDGTTVWIWEIKGSVFTDYRLDSQMAAASDEAARYADYLNKFGDGSREYKVGQPLQSELTLDYTTKGNIDQVVTVGNAPKKGGGLYYKTDDASPPEPPPEPPEPPEPPPTTPDDPWDPFSLGNPLTRESPGERLEQLNDTLNATPDRIDDAFDRSRDRINEGLNDELNPFDGKDDARISTALDESADDIANAVRESLLGIARAVSPFTDH